MTASLSRIGVFCFGMFAALTVSGCTTSARQAALVANPAPALPSQQYPLRADTTTEAVHLRVNSEGLSENQRRALDQIADKANWIDGRPVNIVIVTSPAPSAVDAGGRIYAYLTSHDVDRQNVSMVSAQGQPGDIVTLNLVSFHARVYDCNLGWENLSATAQNKPYTNYGCALSANTAAMVADPRDLASPAAAASTDMARKSVVLDKYRKGDVTSSAQDEQSKGNVANVGQ